MHVAHEHEGVRIALRPLDMRCIDASLPSHQTPRIAARTELAMKSPLTLGLTFTSMSLFIGACDQRPDANSTGRTAAPADASPRATAPDNTARNKAEPDAPAKTPMDQSNSTSDINITADIRRAIMNDSAMSVNAQNCKIITEKSGVVTLRGPVDSQIEKDSIESKAKAIAGVTQVINELEVKHN